MTQLVFSFTTTPFILLSFSDSLMAWRRVYFYGLVGTFTTVVFFATPAKSLLPRALSGLGEKKSQTQSSSSVGSSHTLTHSASQDSLSTRTPVLGMPLDPERELGEAMSEIRAEVVRRRQKLAKSSP